MPKTVRNSGATSSRKIELTERENEALTLRLVGLAYTDIGKRMGISDVRALQLVKSAMKRREASYMDTLEAVRTLELARLDHMFSTHFTKQATDQASAALCLKIMERRTAYLGLDAPAESRVAHTVSHEKRDYDLSKLTLEELRAFRTLAEKMGTIAELPAPDSSVIEGELADDTDEQDEDYDDDDDQEVSDA